MEISKKTTMLSDPFCSHRDMLITGAATGILFGLHPLHVESVAWISQRKDVLCALFFLLSIWSYAEYIVAGEKDPGSKTAFACASDKRYLLSLGFFILAILSKPMAVTLPVVLLILDWYPFQRITSFESSKTAVMGKLPFFALSIGSSVMTVLAQTSGRAIVPLEYTSFPTRVVVAVQSLIIYLEKMVLPVNLIPFYPYPRNISFLSPEYIVPIVLVAGITWISISLTKKTHFFLAAWSFYVLTLLPVLGIIQAGDQSTADCYTYLPSLGPFFALGLSVALLDEREIIPGIATLASRVSCDGSRSYLDHRHVLRNHEADRYIEE